MRSIYSDFSSYRHTDSDPEVVETAQRQKLGPFFKKMLPCGTDPLDFQRLGLLISSDRPPTDGFGHTANSIVAEAFATSGFKPKVVALIGKSGCGKTTTIFELAKKYFVLYIDCFPSKDSPDMIPIYSTLENVVFKKKAEGPINTWNEMRNFQRNLTHISHEGTCRLILARMSHLLLLLNNQPDLTPETYLKDQLNGGRSIITRLCEYANRVPYEHLYDMINMAVNMIFDMTGSRGPVIALDEAQCAANILHDIIVSPSAVDKNDLTVWDTKKKVIFPHALGRGVLSLFAASLQYFGIPLIISGTALTLSNAEIIVSAVGKKEFTVHTVIHFPSCRNPRALLDAILNLDDCVLSPEQTQSLTGRVRFATSVLSNLSCPPGTNKQAALDTAITVAIEVAKKHLNNDVRKYIGHSTQHAAKLGQLVLAWHMHHGCVEWMEQQDVDSLAAALCSIEAVPSHGARLKITEPLVISVIEEVLSTPLADIQFPELVKLLGNILSAFGISSAVKGNALDPIVQLTMAGFHGTVADLPFLQDCRDRLPAWCHAKSVNIPRIGTATDFGLSPGYRGDIEFLASCNTAGLLIEQHGTRADGAWFFDREYAGSLANKFSCSTLQHSIHNDNVSSSNLRNSFCKKDGKVNQNLVEIRREFTKSPAFKLKGILRVHIELPGPPTDTIIEGEDVLVFIDQAKLDLFFHEDPQVNTYAKHMAHIKQIIRACFLSD